MLHLIVVESKNRPSISVGAKIFRVIRAIRVRKKNKSVFSVLSVGAKNIRVIRAIRVRKKKNNQCPLWYLWELNIRVIRVIRVRKKIISVLCGICGS